MLCLRCKKNQATKTYERVKNGEREKEYYCLSCYHHAVSEAESATVRTACPYCGTTVAEIKKRNLVGCAYCYTMLAPTLQPMIQKMQGKAVHSGVKPYTDEADKLQKRIIELKTLAEKCYMEDDTESAARYEEQIARLMAGDEEEYVWDNRNFLQTL